MTDRGSKGTTRRSKSSADPVGGTLRRARRERPLHGLPWYFDLSRRPLQMLVFLAPLIAMYALGTWQFGTDPQTGEIVTISAYRRFIDFFSIFGVTGLYLPGAALVTVLLVWHVLARDKWEIHIGVPVLMWVESLLLAVPLLVMDQVLTRLAGAPAANPGAMSTHALGPWIAAGVATTPIVEFPWQTRLVLSVGAGLYEELLFRMVGIALLHFIFVDLFRMKDHLGTILAVLISAVAFAAYHDLTPGASTTIDLQLAAFYLICGVYFGAIFVVRGFGIAVGVHAAYDIFVIVILPLLTASSSS